MFNNGNNRRLCRADGAAMDHPTLSVIGAPEDGPRERHPRLAIQSPAHSGVWANADLHSRFLCLPSCLPARLPSPSLTPALTLAIPKVVLARIVSQHVV